MDSTTDQEFMSKSNLSAKVQYIHLWLMTDKLVMSRAEKKSQKHKLIAVFEVNKLKITKLTVEADGSFFTFFFFLFMGGLTKKKKKKCFIDLFFFIRNQTGCYQTFH